MALADVLTCDELTQVERGLAWLLEESTSPESTALQQILENAQPNPGKFFLFQDDERGLPTRMHPDDMPAIVMVPHDPRVELWNASQGKIEHSIAILGYAKGRSSRAANELCMTTLRALFQHSGKIPDATPDGQGGFQYSPANQVLDFVQGMRLAGGIQRTPVARLALEPTQSLEDDGPGWYKIWGFRVALIVECRASILGG